MAGLRIAPPPYMDDDELRMFADAVARFLDHHVAPADVACWREQGHVDRALWSKAGEAGLLGISVPEAYGGVGADFRYEAVLIDLLGRRGVHGFSLPLHNAVIAPYIVEYGTDAQKRRWLPGVMTGETILAIAMTEPAAGSDLRGMQTTAVRDGDDYILNGQKTFISNGLLADMVVVAAKTDPAGKTHGISLFAVDAKAKGFSRGALLEKLGQEGRDTTELFFSDLRVSAADRLGEEGGGLAMLMRNLPQERLVIALQSMAMMEAALVDTIDYVRQRKAFGKTIFDFQNTQFVLAECQTEATIAKVFLNHCVGLLLTGELDAATASMAKYWVSEAQGRIVDKCLQLFGGYGYMLEYPIAQMYRDARGFRIYGGTNEIMKLLIARSLA